MKILFAVSNENVSNKIVDSYQKKYGEAVSYKNVFYFNAIIREIHKDKTYDRIVISEDLEPFSSSNYDVIDKFILERFKEISYEISSQDKFIDVVVICTDRRTKSGYVLSKMYEYGIYNALVGTDRRIDNVCNLLYNPRTEQEAKEYYNIESQVDTSSVDDVSEQEVQNILIHYKRLGKNEDRYTDSFNNIAAQYTDQQLKIIIKCLPINVRAVLEAECPKYQELVTYAEETPEEKAQKAKLQEQRRQEQIENEKKLQQKIEREKREAERNAQKERQQRERMQTRTPAQNPQQVASGIDLLDNKRKEQRMTGNVIIPTNMNIRNERKIYTDEELNQISQQPRQQRNIPQPQVAQQPASTLPGTNGWDADPFETQNQQPVQQPASTLPGTNDWDADPFETQSQQPVQQPASTLPGTNDWDADPFETQSQQPVQQPASTLPGMDDWDADPFETTNQQPAQQAASTLPGMDDWDADPFGTQNQQPVQQPASTLPGTNDWDADPFGTQNQQPVQQPASAMPRLEEFDARAQRPTQQPASTLPGLDDLDTIPQQPVQQQSNTLPGLEEFDARAQQPAPQPVAPQPVVQPANTLPGLNDIDANIESNAPAQMQMEAVASQPEIPQEPKRGRGRPRKTPIEPPKPKGKRGRPRKNPLPEEKEEKVEEKVMPKIDQFDDIPPLNIPQPTESMAQTSTLPGTNDWDSDPFGTPNQQPVEQPASTLPGTNDWDADPFGTQNQQPVEQPASTLPGTNDWDTDPFGTQNQQPVQQPASTLPGTNDWDADPFGTQNQQPVQQPASTLSGTNDWDADPFATPNQQPVQQPASTLPGTNDWDTDPFGTPNQQPVEQPASTLPGTNDWDSDPFATSNLETASTSPESNNWDEDPFAKDNGKGITLSSSVVSASSITQPQPSPVAPIATPAPQVQEETVSTYEPTPDKVESMQKIEENRLYTTGSLNTVLTKDKKIVAFVGASKNGTSFLVNNLACLFSSIGVKTAILDMTKNKNSYYIYTNNDEKLRNIAYTAIENLENGIAEGIQVDRNLSVYTAIPNDGKDYSNAEAILSTLVQNESLVLIDCDLKTDLSYFANAQEIYLVQSMDILTIQPLTAFLRELKTKGILDPEKLRIVVNKEVKVKSLTSKAIIGGMSFYNDPAMSYMTELFNKDKIRACSIPFDENVYSKYLEEIVNCQISINGYGKSFMNSLKMLGNMVYPLLSKQTYSSRSAAEANYGNNFSTEMNNTLNQMKNKY